MTAVRVIHKPDITLVWYPAYAVPCLVCGRKVNRYFHQTFRGVRRVWAEHRTFGFRQDCLIQETTA